MRGLERLLRGAGLACLLGTIVLCQSVLAHNDGRAQGPIERRANGRRVIHHYELVRVQKVSAELNEYTYRAWLTNFGAPLTGATATVTSQAHGTTIVDATLTFAAVGTGRTVASARHVLGPPSSQASLRLVVARAALDDYAIERRIAVESSAGRQRRRRPQRVARRARECSTGAARATRIAIRFTTTGR